MYLLILITIILSFAIPGTVLAANDALASGQEIRHKLNVCAKDERVCPYYATCCKLGEKYCSGKSKNCEKVLLPGEKTLLDVCCEALHDVEKLNRSGVHEACQFTYGTIDLWPRYCTAVSTTGSSTPYRLPPTDIAHLDKSIKGLDEPRKIRILEKVHSQPVSAGLTDEGAATHNAYQTGFYVLIGVVGTAVLVGGIIFLVYLKKTEKWPCFAGRDVNSDVENIAESNNFDNKHLEQTEMLASIGYSAHELHLQQQGPFQAALTEKGETPGGPPVGPGSSEPNGGSMNISEGEDITTETTCLTGSPGQVFLE